MTTRGGALLVASAIDGGRSEALRCGGGLRCERRGQWRCGDGDDGRRMWWQGM